MGLRRLSNFDVIMDVLLSKKVIPFIEIIIFFLIKLKPNDIVMTFDSILVTLNVPYYNLMLPADQLLHLQSLLGILETQILVLVHV